VRWLIPRLPDFVARHPGVEPQLLTSTLSPVNAPEPFDIAIRHGTNGWPPAIKVRPFLEDELLIVSAPSLLRRRPIARPQSLAAHALLMCKTRRQDWDDWKKHVGLPRLRPARRLQFDHMHIVLQAAMDGLGFAVTPRSFVGNAVTSRQLVLPLPRLTMPLNPIYFGMTPGAGREARLFADWLMARGAEERTP
jgi:LysR family glycine cleavage system transcriptional activator